MEVLCKCGTAYNTLGAERVGVGGDCRVWTCPTCHVYSDDRAGVSQPYEVQGWGQSVLTGDGMLLSGMVAGFLLTDPDNPPAMA